MTTREIYPGMPGLPDGLRARSALRDLESRRREQWKHVRDPRVEPFIKRDCAIAYVSEADTNGEVTNGPYSLNHNTLNVATGDLIVLAPQWSNIAGINSVTSITDTIGNTYLTANSAKLGVNNNNQAIGLFYCISIGANASNVIVVSLTTNLAGYCDAGAINFSGIAASPLDAVPTPNTSGAGNATVTSNSYTTAQADEVIIFVGGQNGPFNAATSPGTFTRPYNSSKVVLQYLIVSSIQTGVTTALTQTSGTADIGIILATFKATGGGPTGTLLQHPGMTGNMREPLGGMRGRAVRRQPTWVLERAA